MQRRRFLSLNTLASVGLAGEWPAVALPLSTRPTHEQTGLTFLFQGDSITDGNRGRTANPNHSMEHGYAFGVASRIGADFPERDFLFYNRGISGNKLTDLAKRWPTDTFALKLNIFSLLISINDTYTVVSNDAKVTPQCNLKRVFASCSPTVNSSSQPCFSFWACLLSSRSVKSGTTGSGGGTM